MGAGQPVWSAAGQGNKVTEGSLFFGANSIGHWPLKRDFCDRDCSDARPEIRRELERGGQGGSPDASFGLDFLITRGLRPRLEMLPQRGSSHSRRPRPPGCTREKGPSPDLGAPGRTHRAPRKSVVLRSHHSWHRAQSHYVVFYANF